MKNPVKPELQAAGIFMNIAPSAAADRLKFVQCHFKTARADPLHIKIGVRECFVKQLRRRVKFPGDKQLLFPRLGGNFSASDASQLFRQFIQGFVPAGLGIIKVPVRDTQIT